MITCEGSANSLESLSVSVTARLLETRAGVEAVTVKAVPARASLAGCDPATTINCRGGAGVTLKGMLVPATPAPSSAFKTWVPGRACGKATEPVQRPFVTWTMAGDAALQVP